MTRPKTDSSIESKIAKVFQSVGKLPRAGTNGERHYPYTRASDVFEAVRAKFFSLGLLLIPQEDAPEYVTVATSNGGEQITECRLCVKYTFTDGTKTLGPITVHGTGRDVDDKALYKAQTGAEKALLKRMGLMAEAADDPEFDGRESGETLDDVAPRRVPRKEKPLAGYQIENIREAMLATGKSEEQLLEKFRVPDLGDVKQKLFRDLLTWASDGKGTVSVPKLTAVPAPEQSLLQLRAAPSPNQCQLKIGSKTVNFEPTDKAYSL